MNQAGYAVTFIEAALTTWTLILVIAVVTVIVMLLMEAER